MRYFDKKLVANSKLHAAWWADQVTPMRDYFHFQEDQLAAIANATAALPRDAWMDFDTTTARVMRSDEGEVWMTPLMALAKPVDIGKIALFDRVSSDAGTVVRSLSGQVPVPVDKVTYDYRGTIVPVFATGYGREWREWNALQSENFDALADDQEAHLAKIKRDNALYVLNGDATIKHEGVQGYGIKNHPLTKTINLGTGAGGVSLDLTAADGDALDAFITGPFGAMLDANKVLGGVNVVVSPEIGRNLDKQYSGSAGFKAGRVMDFLLTSRRINRIDVSSELTGNQFFAYVPSAQYIRPVIGMATSTVAMPRAHPRANYQFEIWNAMGIQIRGDFAGNSGVFSSVVVNT